MYRNVYGQLREKGTPGLRPGEDQQMRERQIERGGGRGPEGGRTSRWERDFAGKCTGIASDGIEPYNEAHLLP